VIRALTLHATHAATLARGARAARPLEYCAALLGRVDGGVAAVTDVVRLRNCDTSPGRFSVPDDELRRARLLAGERRGRVAACQVVALAHSHASAPAAPSARDLLALAHSRHPWMIVGFDGHDGVELAVFLAGTGAQIPVLVVEASLDPGDGGLANSSGDAIG
jgi:proteasome lid subunit RPN8/RPN11